MKEKMLMKLERDRIKVKIEATEAQMKAMQVSLYAHAHAPASFFAATVHGTTSIRKGFRKRKVVRGVEVAI